MLYGHQLLLTILEKGVFEEGYTEQNVCMGGVFWYSFVVALVSGGGKSGRGLSHQPNLSHPKEYGSIICFRYTDTGKCLQLCNVYICIKLYKMCICLYMCYISHTALDTLRENKTVQAGF